jgi:DNA modification methylase/ParB-like chromosome segregation protein Spo0J
MIPSIPGLEVPQSKPSTTPTEEFPKTVFNRSKDNRPYLKVSDIIIRADRGRKTFARIIELSESLKQFGMLNPVVVRPDPTQLGKYHLIAGERRYRAALLAGWSEIPYTLRGDVDDLTDKEIELEENVARENLDWPEVVELQAQIHDLKIKKYGIKVRGDEVNPGWNMTKTAEMLGKPTSTLARELLLARQLQERPDLKERLTSLPKSHAMRAIDQILEAEKRGRLVEMGQLKFQSDLRVGDCTKLIKDIPDGSVHLVLVDPPYGNVELEEVQGKDSSGAGNFQYQAAMKVADNLDRDTVLTLLAELFKDYYRVLAPGCHLYMFHTIELFPTLCDIATSAGFVCQPYPLIWDKTRPTTRPTGYSYLGCYEPILYAHKPPQSRRLNETSKAILPFKPVNVKERFHVFQKPQDLLCHLISQSTQVGETVLDTFAGSGSTLQAAKTLKRSAIGIELDAEHALKAQLFLSDTVKL